MNVLFWFIITTFLSLAVVFTIVEFECDLNYERKKIQFVKRAISDSLKDDKYV